MKLAHSICKLFAVTALTGMFAVTAAQAQDQAPPPQDANVQADGGVQAETAPPPLPSYDQPPIPGDGYLWTPGYWAYGDNGYYWVDGAWVYPPYVGALWTPGWWGFGSGFYFWHPGLWGRSIGYYGGINYGFGYFGVGFYGGYWNGGRFFYNRAYGNFGVGFRGSFYNRPYNGFAGRPGGLSYNAHPPAGFAGGVHGVGAYPHGSPVNGNAFRGAPGNVGGQGGFHGAPGSYNRAPAQGAQPHGNSGGGHSAPAPHASSGGGHSRGGGGGSHGGGGHR